MDQTSNDFGRICLPYCVQRCADGRWIVLNRNGDPVGCPKGAYADFPTTSVPSLELSEANLRSLSWDGRIDRDQVFLYADASDPLSSYANWNAYCRRLAFLVGLDRAQGHQAASLVGAP